MINDTLGARSRSLLRSSVPANRRGLSVGICLAVVLAATLVKLAFFAWLERPWGCDCGLIWTMPTDPELNSRVMLDPYTLMHVVAGGLMAHLLMALRPRWSLWTLLAAVVVSSTIWELAENLPASIHLFNYDPDEPLAYRGDSRLNALADTGAAVLGAALARPLPWWVVVLVVAGLELVLALWIGDGFMIGLLRAAGLLP